MRRKRFAALGAASIAGAVYWTLLSSQSQLLGRFPYRMDTAERVVALTFDDGPNEPFTSQIADFLAARSIRATFFQVGKCVERFPDIPRRLVEQGHVVGNHSYSHHVVRCLRPSAQATETTSTQTILTAAIGRRPALYRPPWLLRTPPLLRLLDRLGLQPISGLFCHAFEVFQPPPARIAARALAKVRPGAIIIFHDGFDSRGGNRAATAGAVEIVVDTLERDGYRFVTVDELLGVDAYQPLEAAD